MHFPHSETQHPISIAIHPRPWQLFEISKNGQSYFSNIFQYGELLSVPESWQGGVADITHWAGCFKASSNTLFCNNVCKFPFLNSALIYSFIVLFLNTVLIFSWSTKLMLGCARSHWHQSPASCSMLLLVAISSAHVIPCPSHRVVFLKYFSKYCIWLKLWLNFRSRSSHVFLFFLKGGSLWFSQESSGRRQIFAPHWWREGRRSGIGSGA